MTNDEQYVPSDEDMRWHYAVKRMDDGATRTHAEQEYTRWLAAHDARVRRDAAANALYEVATNIDNYDDYVMVHNRAKRIEETP